MGLEGTKDVDMIYAINYPMLVKTGVSNSDWVALLLVVFEQVYST